MHPIEPAHRPFVPFATAGPIGAAAVAPLPTALRLLAWVQVAIGGGGLLAAATLVAVVARAPDRHGHAAAVLLPIAAMLTLVAFLPALAAGLGLLRGRRWGHPLMIVVCALQLLAVPLGTVLGGLGLWLLFRHPAPAPATLPAVDAEGARDDYPVAEHAANGDFAPAGASTATRAPSAPLLVLRPAPVRGLGMLAAFAGVAAGFVVLLGTGFHLSGDPIPRELDTLYVPAIAVLVLAVGYGAVAFGRLPRARVVSGVPFGGWRETRARHAVATERALRIARLAADPRRARFAPLVERGEVWSDEQIDYELDPAAAATCAHLQPIERAMRAAGIRMRPWPGRAVDAQCVVDPVALAAHFALPPSVRFEEVEGFDRSDRDPPFARIGCSDCASVLTVRHERDARGAPRFPRHR